jgi:hypothetical protein
VAQGAFGQLVTLRDGKLASIGLDRVASQMRRIQPDDPLLQTARQLGVHFGEAQPPALPGCGC